MERLAAADRLMLWPDQRWPQEIGAVALMEGDGLRDDDGRFRIENLRRAIDARLHLVPRFRQVLYLPRRGLGGPLWADAQGFDLAHHVTVTEVAAPGDEVTLIAAVEQLITRPLDRSRPLWEMRFLTGLSDRRIGLLVRMHHAIADGIAGMAMLGAFLDSAPGTVTAPAPQWERTPLPGARALLVDNIRRHASAAREALGSVSRLVRTAGAARGATADLRMLFQAPTTPRTSLDNSVGRGRRVHIIRGALDPARQIARRHGATVNDMLLAVTAAGLRGLLASRGELTSDLALPVYVPVTLRRTDRCEQPRGNMIGQSVVALPVGEPEPSRRLERIAAGTADVKSRRHVDLGRMFKGRLARGALLAFLKRHPVSVTTADIPGPRQPLYLADAQLQEVFPLLPLIGNVTIGVGALSYAGQFNVTIVTDPDTIPDADVVATFAERELREFFGSATAPI